MKKSIGIDCSKLNNPCKTGTHRFLVGFLNELVKNDEFEYFFYVNKDGDFLKQFSFAKKGKVICLNYPFLYTQIGLLKSLKNHDFFLFPWQTLPLLGIWVGCKKVSIIHDLGYSLNSTKVRQLDLPNFFILSVGRVEKRKNVYNNIKAFSKLKKYYPNLKYIFIGNYIEDEKKIYSLIKDLEMNEGEILFKNNISDSELNIYLNSMEFLVFTSLEEGFGLPVLEAYSVQKPVLLSKIEQLAEFKISANQFVDPYNVSEISEKMIKFLKKDHGIKSKKDYKEILSKFSWKRSAETFIKGLK